MGILILCALVILVSGYLAWQNYNTSKKEDSPVAPTEESLPKFDSEPDLAAAPVTPVQIVTTPSSGYAPKSSGLGVLGTIENKESMSNVSGDKPKRGRKPGTQPKDSFKKKDGKKGPKPKKDKGNDLLLS
jgi:hypothetical protein